MLRVLFLILVLMSSIAFAQKQKQTQAFKFDEFTELQESDWKRRLDRFADMKISLPDSKLEIIVYAQIGTQRNSIHNLERQFKDYLSNVKKVGYVYVKSGGFRKSQSTELWIVPENAKSPDTTPDEEFKAEKFAEIGVVSDEELKLKMDEFENEQNKNTSDTGYIITYGIQKEISERERKMRDSLRLRRYDSSRIVLLSHNDGGNLRTVFWLVPYGAKLPTP